MLDSETIDLLPQFLETVAKLGFSQEHIEGEDCLLFIKKQPIKTGSHENRGLNCAKKLL
ncbi:MAG: hypothetical protein HPY58_14260 [Firmicutes bacterium]|nr:hypothetical protein [Bacillota bacterium]